MDSRDHDVTTGYVYFIAAQGTDLVKIGWAMNPKHRLACLQTGSTIPLEMLRVLPAVRADEKRLHRQFAGCRANREWFHLVPELQAFIKGLSRKPWGVLCGDIEEPTWRTMLEVAGYEPEEAERIARAMSAPKPPPEGRET